MLNAILHIAAFAAVLFRLRDEVTVGHYLYHRKEQDYMSEDDPPEIRELDEDGRAMFYRVRDALGLRPPSCELLVIHRSIPNECYRVLGLWWRRGLHWHIGRHDARGRYGAMACARA
jgi:hypothetical protein